MDCRRHPLRTYVRTLVKLGVSEPGSRANPLILASAVGRIVGSMVALDRVQERRRAVALARHYRDEEGLSIAEIARRLGRAEATVKAYLYDRPMLTKHLRIAPRANASLGATRAAFGAFPDHEVAPGLSTA